MTQLVLMLAASLLSLVGFAWLALSQERHFEQVHGSPMPAGRRWGVQRGLGGAAIALALPLCVVGEGGGFGTLLWLVMISSAAMAVTFTLTWRPRWLRAMACRSRRGADRRTARDGGG